MTKLVTLQKKNLKMASDLSHILEADDNMGNDSVRNVGIASHEQAEEVVSTRRHSQVFWVPVCYFVQTAAQTWQQLEKSAYL